MIQPFKYRVQARDERGIGCLMSTQEVNLRSSLSGGFYELTLISGIREVDFEWFSTSGETFRFGGSVARSSARKFEI
jgi:hypothetical protein